MADTRTQRGPHPKDERCFSPEELPKLRAAVDDLSWLLSRGYSHRSASKLVGDRYTLRDRQRKALQRCAASDQACDRRARARIEAEQIHRELVLIDGYNVLLTVEAALSGGVLLLARDGTLRDVTALGRHYRPVLTSRPALGLIGSWLLRHGVSRSVWYFDQPVSNSGRLKALVEEVAREQSWPLSVELVGNPDLHLQTAPQAVATADSGILDRCQRWLNLARLVVESSVPEAWILRFERLGDSES